jgi:hypothetical protein
MIHSNTMKKHHCFLYMEMNFLLLLCLVMIPWQSLCTGSQWKIIYKFTELDHQMCYSSKVGIIDATVIGSIMV